MSAVERGDDRRLMLFSGRAHVPLAEEIAEYLSTSLSDITARDFASGETFTRPNESVRGADAFVVQSFTEPVNEWVMETLILVDSLRRASARRISVVMPYYPYSRQDKMHRGQEPISARLLADLFTAAGADRLMTADLHAAQIQGFFDGPVDHLYALPLLADYVLGKYGDRDLVVVSPDAGRVRSAEDWSNRLGGVDIAFVHKTRNIDIANESEAHRVVGEVAGRVAILIDDMIDTGGSIGKAANLLHAQGAEAVVIAATHGIFSPPADGRLRQANVTELIVTNTLPLQAEKGIDSPTVLSIAPLFAKAIKAVFEGSSVTTLFDGNG